MNERFAKTPEPPYYAVIFTSRLSENPAGYDAMGIKMFDLASEHPGCLGVETTRDAEGIGITVSYWKDEESLKDWKEDTRHLVAQKLGIERWYPHYELRVARVERAYSGPDGRAV
ncbi:antibiotic biosynthesis monooxygenase [Pelagibius sp. Alg239-R121]|uniref:antibiotic biosynthesis monooxygenase family protein n=1 Tax=Pelagibius sp. Alg239-R121 TaxID=2993448 RepID=UPI0024A70973|nr:antibiotic biosynthesis monooxygenase [Pelagibius sp. Alg239-R121]